MKKRMIVLGICVLLLTILFTGCMNGDSSDDSSNGFEPPESTPTVTMIQSDSYISIAGVWNGPVENASASVVVINQSTGAPVTNAGMIRADVVGNATNVDVGDTISITLTGESSGTRFTVQMLYGGDVIGSCIYTVP